MTSSIMMNNIGGVNWVIQTAARMLFAALLFGCAAHQSPKSPTVDYRNQADSFPYAWKILGPFLSAPREGMIDHLLKYGGESAIVPSDEQIFYSELSKDAELKWRSVENRAAHVEIVHADADWQKAQATQGLAGIMNVTYAYSEMDFPKAFVALVHVKDVRQIFVNGRMYWGQPYGYSHYVIPIPFEMGRNRVLLKIPSYENPAFEFSFRPTNDAVFIGEDVTLPDLVEGDVQEKILMGIPLVNATHMDFENVRLRVSTAKGVIAEIEERWNLIPLSVSKIPIALSRRDVEAELKIELVDKVGTPISAKKLILDEKKSTDAQILTFQSQYDGSIQPYSILPPKDLNPQRIYDGVLALHGANVTSSVAIKTYAPKDWAYVIAPTNRRPHGFAWQNLGRLDALEALNDAGQRFRIDPKRIILTGHSMGGQGVWHIGVFHPDLFMGLAPAAGWTSFDSYSPAYLQRSSTDGSLELKQLRERAELDSNNPYFLNNVKHLPIFITQARGDRTVTPFHSRKFFKLRNEDAANLTNYREIASDEHWCREPLIEGVGFQCVDHPLQYEFLRHQRPNESGILEIRLNDLSINSVFKVKDDVSFEVLAQDRVMSPTWFLLDTNTKPWTLKSSNITHIRIVGPSRGEQAIVWNNIKKSSKVDAKGAAIFALKASRPRIPARFSQSLALYGTMKAVFHSPALIVLGTKGTTEEREKLLHLARLLSNRIWATANSFTPVVKDSELTLEMKKKYNLILLGNGTRNRHAITLPLKELWQRKGAAIVTVRPSPWKKDGLLLAVAGSSAEAELQTAEFLPMVERQNSAHLDFLITTPEVKKLAWGGLAAAGFYSNQWDLTNHDYVEGDLSLHLKH